MLLGVRVRRRRVELRQLQWFQLRRRGRRIQLWGRRLLKRPSRA
ncbi:hypothetical protein P376_0270 [Streptomyces sp. HCCB10043]|nr:hypothetical protein P376_0270 [Streptomyces sp. HCCB10043]